MAVAMEVVWRGAELGGAGAVGMSASTSKKRAWGADTEKLMQLMMGQFGRNVKKEEKVTLDLFGATSELELDPDQPLPSNWEKCLDLKTGGVYFVNKTTGVRTTEDPRKEFQPRGGAAAATTSSPTPLEFLGSKMSETLRGESLRASTSSSTSTGKQLWNLQLDEDNLELNLNLSPSPTRPQQSVCTMEMVERALKTVKKKPKLTTSSSFSSLTSLRSDNSHSTSSSSSTSSHAADSTTTTTLVMGACTRCLMYVMLHKRDPKCPRCEIDVPLDSFVPCKRQRVDAHSP